MKKLGILFLLFSFLGFLPLSLGQGLDSIAICAQAGYKELTNRNGIVVAVLDPKNSKILTFGNGKETEIFEIGSITKTFTAQLLAQQVLGGRLRLSDPIPVLYQKPGSIITYQHLTTHTSGIIAGLFPTFKVQNPLSPFEGLTIPVFKELYSSTSLESAPGFKWNYSNIGSSLLGIILAERAQVPYEIEVQNKIFNPLKMRDSYFAIPSHASARFSHGFMRDPSGQLHKMPPWDLYKTAINPAGGIRSTIRDMIKYARAQLAPQTTPLSNAIRLTQSPLATIREPNTKIGMNWILQPDQNLIWHNGQTYGFNSILVVSKKRNQAIVALTDTTVMIKGADGSETFDASLQDVAFRCLK